MSKLFRRALWEVELPIDWLAKAGEDCSSFFAQQKEVGVLQLSALQKDKVVTNLDLQEFATEEIPAEVESSPVRFGSFTPTLSQKMLTGECGGSATGRSCYMQLTTASQHSRA
jgi:hypothetical protein